MKKILSIMMAVAISLSSCIFLAGDVNAKDKTVLRVYNWGEYISDGADDTLDVIAEFEKRFPDIDVEYTTFDTNESMYAKLASGSANYDVIIPSDYMISKMINEDMLAKLDYANIPNAKNIDAQFRKLEFDKNDEYSVPYTWGTVGIIYDKTKVTEPVTSWDILWNEKYKGQILMFDNPRDAYGIAEKKLGISQNSTDKAELDKVKAELIKQKDVIQSYVMDDIFAKMTGGEAALAPYYAGDAITMISDNPKLDFAVPNEGTNKFVDSMCVLKSSKNKAIAEKFINFMLEPDIAKANIEYIGYSTPMKNVKEILDEDLKNSPIAYPSDELLSKCETFINLPEETTTYIQDGWVEIKAYGENNVTAIITLSAIGAVVIILAVFFIMKKRKNK